MSMLLNIIIGYKTLKSAQLNSHPQIMHIYTSFFKKKKKNEREQERW